MLSQKTPYKLVPQLGWLRDEVVYDDVWEQPEPSKGSEPRYHLSVDECRLRGHLLRARYQSGDI